MIHPPVCGNIRSRQRIADTADYNTQTIKFKQFNDAQTGYPVKIPVNIASWFTGIRIIYYTRSSNGNK
jgi:hypothetical protein